MSKPRGRPFAPGNTVGRGRPKGSRNKPKSPGRQLLDASEEMVTRKCLLLAMQGDRSAMRLCMERIHPARRDASIRLKLPKISTVRDLDRAGEKITQAIGSGQITPGEGETLMNILATRSELIEKSDFESRLHKLERSLAEANRRKNPE